MWELIPVGQIELWKTPHQYIAYAHTTGLGALIFPFRSLWQTRIDGEGYPRITRIEVLERKHPKKKILYFYPREGKVIREKITPRKHLTETYAAPYPLYDELSGFWAAVTHPWHKPKETLLLRIFAGEKAHMVTVRALGYERIKTFQGWRRAFRIQADLPTASELIRHSRKAVLWLSPQGWPLAGEGKIPLGHLKVFLVKVLKGAHAPPPPKALLDRLEPVPD
ncbi:DUF3108 domain-containing protein [Thermosulfurimonas sp.]|uniref:DUF3108 domain-containing protein n=1 Tax=Thermosulfurimonas sp. TaxID=2080236 RepID=UPI00341F5568